MRWQLPASERALFQQPRGFELQSAAALVAGVPLGAVFAPVADGLPALDFFGGGLGPAVGDVAHGGAGEVDGFADDGRLARRGTLERRAGVVSVKSRAMNAAEPTAPACE